MEAGDLEKIVKKILNLINQSRIQKKLLVFSGESRYSIDSFFIEAREISKKTPVKIAVDPCAQRYLSQNKISELQSMGDLYGFNGDTDPEVILEGVDAVAFGSMDISAASKIASLTTDSLSSKIASLALLKGIKLLSSDFMKGLETKNNTYYLSIKRIVEILKSYGVEFLPVDEIKKQFFMDISINSDDTSAVSLVTEKFIKEYPYSELKLDQNTIITPLAKDAIRERKIVISRGE